MVVQLREGSSAVAVENLIGAVNLNGPENNNGNIIQSALYHNILEYQLLISSLKVNQPNLCKLLHFPAYKRPNQFKFTTPQYIQYSYV